MLFTPLTEFRQNYLTALGNIVVAFGHLEEVLATLMRSIVDNAEFGNLLVTGYYLDKVLDNLRAAFYSSNKKKTESIIFEYLLDRIWDVHGRRNDNVYAQWFFRDDVRKAYRIKLVKHKHGIISTRKVKFNIPLCELHNLASDIFELGSDIELFRLVVFLSEKVTFPPGELAQYKEQYAQQVTKANAATKKKSKKKSSVNE